MQITLSFEFTSEIENALDVIFQYYKALEIIWSKNEIHG